MFEIVGKFVTFIYLQNREPQIWKIVELKDSKIANS